MSTLDVFMAELGISVAILMLRYGKPRGLVDYVGFTIVMWGAVMCVFNLVSAV